MNEPNFAVDLLNMGIMPRCPRCGAVMLCDLDQFQPWGYSALVARSAETTVVINTGFPLDMGPVQAFFKSWHPACDVQRDEQQTMDGHLTRLGVDPAQVDHLLLSCLGPYSTGRVELFTNATIHIGRTEWIDYHAPPKNFPPQPRDTIIPPATLSRLIFEDWHRVNLLQDEDEICPGIRVFRTGGHHQGSLAVAIRTREGVLVYADTIFTYENFQKNLPIGFFRDQDEYHAAVHRIRREADLVVPFFDPIAFERYPDGVVTR
jgi:glyoxylase-like metal-dependent hydrolase (beta-lactamase superfamily II)